MSGNGGGGGGAMENLVGSPESLRALTADESQHVQQPPLKPKSAFARLRASFGSITRTQCAVMSLCYLCYGVSYLTYEPFILLKDQLQTSLELSTALLSSYDTLYMASFSTCMFLAGAMIDRVGSKALLVGSLAGSSCVVFGFAMASAGSWFLAPLWFLNGAIQAISYPGCLAILLPHFSAGVRGTVVGIWYSSTLVGQVSSSIMTAYADSIGATWRQVFYIGSGVSLISALLLLFFLPATHVKSGSYTPLRRDSDPDLSINQGGAAAVVSSGALVPEYEETTTATSTADGGESVVVSFRPLASGSPQRKPSAGGSVVPVNLAAASDGAFNAVTRPAAVATPVRVDSDGNEVRPEGMRESLLSGDSAKSDEPSFGSTYVPTAACCGKPHDSLTVCPQSPTAKESAGAVETKPLSYREIIAMPGVFRISIAYLFAKVSNYSLCAWLPYMLNRHLGYSEGTAAGFATVYQTGLAVGCSFFGIMADKYFPGREVLAARYIIGLGIVFYALYAFFGGQAYWVNAVILFPLSASLGGADVLISSTVPYRVADREGFSAQAATLTGIINGFGCVGGVAQGVWAAYWMDEGWQPYLWSLSGFYVLAFFIPWGIK